MISFKDATATGVPPRVPTLETAETGFVRRYSFDSAALTKPTGVPMIRAGTIPSSMNEHTAKRADGAFPITTIEPDRRSFNAVKPAELRVMPSRFAISAP